ncbi:uncharacterized protein LOC144912786 [Branchiostoma floridae x Branchiostoma belcheri]
MERNLQHVLIFLLIILKEPNMLEADCSASCSPSLCNCANFHLTSIPQNLPKTISILGLKNNQITTISQSEFARYENLIELDLNTNLITNIHNDTFSNLPRLQTLYLHINKITKIQFGSLSNLPELQKLWLNSNKIIIIHFGLFSNLPQLQDLDLAMNKITKIHPDTFSNLHKLKTLSLQFNQITEIQAGTLSSQSQLEFLMLNSNQITNIQPDTLPYLPKLRELFLHANKITKIQNGTFSNLPMLQSLFLHSNKISILPLSAYVTFSSIRYVHIDHNPWQCDCKMVPFRLKMNGTFSFENQIKCAQPANLNGQRLKDINPKDLICKEPPVVLWYFNPKYSADQKIPHPVDTTFASLPVDTNKPESTSSHDNSSHESAPRFPLSVVIGTASGSVSGICLIGIIIFTTWCKRRARNLPSDPNTKVASGARNLPTAPQLAPPQSNPMYNIDVETRPNNTTSNEGTEPEKPAETKLNMPCQLFQSLTSTHT